MMQLWCPFIQDCMMLLDGDGTFRHWKYPGAYVNQPWLDIEIYHIIRAKIVHLRNKDIESKYGKNKPKKRPMGSRR